MIGAKQKGGRRVIISSNPHTHTTFSDGRNTPREMVEAALALGFRALGFTDHSVQDRDAQMFLPAPLEEAYRREIASLAERYAGRIRLYASIELDSLYGKAERAAYDYLLLSTHYARLGDRAALVDCRPRREALFALRDSAFGGDGVAMAEAFYRDSGRRALAVRPDIYGHFDIIKYFNADGALFDPGDARIRRAEEEALHSVFASGAILEINTGGMARGYIDQPYPHERILRLWREMGGRVILGSDCHRREQLAFAFEEMLDLLQRLGFTHVCELGGEGEETFVQRRL